MVPDRQNVWTDGRRPTEGCSQNYIPPTSSGDNKKAKWPWIAHGVLFKHLFYTWYQLEIGHTPIYPRAGVFGHMVIRTSDSGNGTHSVSLPMILKKIKIGQNASIFILYKLAVSLYFMILHLISYFNKCMALFLG